MKNIFTCSIALALFHTGAVSAQSDARFPAVDSLYEQGQREMAPKWRGLGKMPDAAVFLHQTVKRRENGQLAVWTHRELSMPQYLEKEKGYLSVRERSLIDCKGAMVGVTDALYYSAHFGNGAVVAMNRGKPAEMAEVVPDSIEERLVNVACAPKPPRKPLRKIKKAKPSETKPAEVKPSETKPAETKLTGTKPSEAKPTEAKSAEAKPSGTKPAETKPVGPKPSEAKPSETTPSGTKRPEIKRPETKPLAPTST
jgi:hypothetical protein